jgi:hypothetical protein
VFVKCGAGRDRDIVEEAEAHRIARAGMMPRWPRQAKRRFVFVGNDTPYRITRRASREQRHVEGSVAYHCVGLDVAAAALSVFLKLLKVAGSMQASDLLNRCRLPGWLLATRR